MGLVNLIGRVGNSSATEWLPVTEQKYMGTHVAYRLYPITSGGLIVHPGCPANSLGSTVFYNAKQSGTPLLFATVERTGNTTTYSDYARGDCNWYTDYASTVLLANASLYGTQQIDTATPPRFPLKYIQSGDYPSGVSPIIQKCSFITLETTDSFQNYSHSGGLPYAPQGMMLWGNFSELSLGGGVLVRSSFQLSYPYMSLKFAVYEEGDGFQAPEIRETALKLAWQDIDHGTYYYYAEDGVQFNIVSEYGFSTGLVYVAFPSIRFAIPGVSVGDYTVSILDNFLVFR